MTVPTPIHGLGGTAPILSPVAPTPPPTAPTPGPAPAGGEPTPDFGKTLGNALGNVLGDAAQAEKTADAAATRFAAGDPEVGIHEVMIAAEKANISVRYAVTLKNKLLEAYRELMNTPL